jgi:DNA-directed RNA polymerase specialized sigma54-like protein
LIASHIARFLVNFSIVKSILSQAIALLQYYSEEISTFFEEKAFENPLLEIESLKEQSMDPRYDKVKIRF